MRFRKYLCMSFVVFRLTDGKGTPQPWLKVGVSKNKRRELRHPCFHKVCGYYSLGAEYCSSVESLFPCALTCFATRRVIGSLPNGNCFQKPIKPDRVAGLSLCCLRRSRITPRSTLDSLYRPRIAPRSVLIDRCCPPIARRSTLNAPRRSQIAPRSTLCARAGHGLLRVQHLESSPRVQIAPYSTLCVPRRSQIAPRSTLPAPYRLRIAPLSAIDAPCRSTDISVRLHFAPCAVHGLLRAQHVKLRTAHRLLCVRRLHFVPITDCSAFLTPCLVLLADCSVLNT